MPTLREIAFDLGITEVAVVRSALEHRNPFLDPDEVRIEREYKERTRRGSVACWLDFCSYGTQVPRFIEMFYIEMLYDCRLVKKR